MKNRDDNLTEVLTLVTSCHTRKSVRGSVSLASCWRMLLLAVVFLAALQTMGCRALRDSNQPLCEADCGLPNPMIVPMMDRWYLMDQVSDELDNYFSIYREERMRVVEGVMTEGWIETHPKIGGTAFEPWKKDSTPGFELAHATMQTVRRFAKVRVIPFGDSYQVDLKVFKELEDLQQPVGSPFGGAFLRHDNTLGNPSIDARVRQPNTGWIPMGRDLALEQEILTNLQMRLRKSVE